MKLKVSKAWRARLRVVWEEQHAAMDASWFAPVEALFPEGVLFLRVSMGHATYLSLDGRVAWTAPDDRPPQAVDDLRAIANIIVYGARSLNFPELVDLLPPRPEGQQACPGCEGRRWDDTPRDGYPEGIICVYCSGLGWLAPRRS